MKVPAGLAPAAAAAATGLQVGAAMVATRYVIDQTAPATLAMMRYIIGCLCLAPVFLAAGPVRFERADVAPVALLGITQFGILIALLNFGLETVPAGRAALIFATFPLLTLLLAAALGREALTAPKLLGVLLSIVGVGLALGEALLVERVVANQWVGVLAVLGSALCGALCSVLYRPYVAKYSALPVSAFAMLASVGFLAVLAAFEGIAGSVSGITATGWLAVLFIGVSSAVGYYLWLWALGRATPTRVTVFLALSPLTAALLGAAFLGERVTAALWAGLACVASGLWLAHRDRTPS